MEKWADYKNEFLSGLASLSATDSADAEIALDKAFRLWLKWTRTVGVKNRSVFIIGNGASASIASHIAADAIKKGYLKAYVFNDPTLLTAIGNDEQFSEVFSLPLERIGRPGDMLISISSSGNSPNIVKALESARKLQMTLVTLSGMTPHNRSRSLGNLNFHIPSSRYGWIESAHQLIMHHWLDQYLNLYGKGAD